MKSNKFLHFLLIVLMFPGCGSFVYYEDTKPNFNQDFGYLYGLFSVEEEGSINIGVLLHNTENKNEYTIKFKEAEKIYPIEIPSGNYKLTKIVFSRNYDLLQSEQDITKLKHISKAFSVEKGNAYYVGDFYGDTHKFSNVASTTLYWRVKDIRYNFEETTKKFIKQNPQFEKVKTIPAFDFTQ